MQRNITSNRIVNLTIEILRKYTTTTDFMANLANENWTQHQNSVQKWLSSFGHNIYISSSIPFWILLSQIAGPQPQ